MSRVTIVPYLDTLLQTAGTPSGVATAATVPTPHDTAAVALNPSPECLDILYRRHPLETMIAGLRERVGFYTRYPEGISAERELAWSKTALADAINNLAVFDVEHLTAECRERLARAGMAFTQPTQAAGECPECEGKGCVTCQRCKQVMPDRDAAEGCEDFECPFIGGEK